MEHLTTRENQKVIKNLQKGLDTSWDIFLNGDKASGTKPGNLQVYGTIAGQRQVLSERRKKQQELEDGSLEK